jgi:hypothetical protein
MVVPHWAPSSVPEPPLELEPEPVAVEPEPTRRRSRIAAPVGTLVATVAASLLVTAFSGGEQARGESPPVSALASSTTAAAASPVTARIAQATESSDAQPDAGADVQVPSGTLPSTPVPGGAVSVLSDSGPPTAARAAAPGRQVALSPTTLVWPRSTPATAYDLELVRDGSIIFTARAGSTEVALPRSWSHEGVTYAIQPEDQAFVWPVVAGRRAEAPLVNGALALDMTLVERFVELSRSASHP